MRFAKISKLNEIIVDRYTSRLEIENTVSEKTYSHTLCSNGKKLMEHEIICPKCGSTEIEVRNHEQFLQKTGGVLLSAAGTTAGTVGGAASGASIGAAIGTVAGPLGVIMGGTIGTFVGAISVGITGGFLGHRFGKKAGVIVDRNVFLDYRCLKCKHRFESKQSLKDQKNQK